MAPPCAYIFTGARVSTAQRELAHHSAAASGDRVYDLARALRVGQTVARSEPSIEQRGHAAGIIAGVTRDGWTGRLWAEAAGTYAAISKHPFLVGLTDGSLDRELFTHYIVQDAHYLREFARTLTIVASKAPTHADLGMFARHAAGIAEVELALHESLLTELGIQNVDAMPVAPTTLAYTSYLLATAHRGAFADGFAAVLPCYWIYAEVGAELVKRGSPDPRYQRWIDTYAGDEYQTIVAEVLALADSVAPTLCAADEVRARAHFATTARYEWMFWDAAWRGEVWPV
jgi:thiaminase/transcriptional activator TenA